MPICVRCRKESGMLGGLLGFIKQTNRCNTCENQVKQSLSHFRQSFIHFCQDGALSPHEWQQLHNITIQGGVDWNEAWQFVRGDALNFLERVLAFMAADEVITEEEERHFHELQRQLMIPLEIARPLVERLNYFKYLFGIRQGKLPVIRPSIHLESDET